MCHPKRIIAESIPTVFSLFLLSVFHVFIFDYVLRDPGHVNKLDIYT